MKSWQWTEISIQQGCGIILYIGLFKFSAYARPGLDNVYYLGIVYRPNLIHIRIKQNHLCHVYI